MMTPPLVVKLGGSLSDHIRPVVDTLRSCGRPILIVPGGGSFANGIRRLCLPEEHAHWMAIAAMDQFGWYISSYGVPASDQLCIPEELTVLLPYIPLREHDPLPHSWDVTSDSIAAWVAHILGLDLIVLKSVDGIREQGKRVNTITHPIRTGDVDPLFIPYVLTHRIRTVVLNGKDSACVAKALRGLPAGTGTTIGF